MPTKPESNAEDEQTPTNKPQRPSAERPPASPPSRAGKPTRPTSGNPAEPSPSPATNKASQKKPPSGADKPAVASGRNEDKPKSSTGKYEKRSAGSHVAAGIEGADSKQAIRGGATRAAGAAKSGDVVGATDEGLQAGAKVAANAFAPGVGGAVTGVLLNTRVGQAVSRHTARFVVGGVAVSVMSIVLVVAMFLVIAGGFLIMISGAGGAAACAPKSDSNNSNISLDEQGARDNGKYIWDSLIKNGFTPEAAGGVLGNLWEESKFNPGLAEGGNGPGRGIVQWGYNGGNFGSNRFNELMAWAEADKKDPYALKTQVEYMLKELKEYGLYDQIRVEKDILVATALFHDKYEMSNDRNVGIYYEREDSAKRWYNTFKNSRAGSTASTPARTAIIAGFSGHLIALIAPAIVRAEPTPSDTVYYPISPYPGSSNGHDIGVPVGTPVYAVADGTVVESMDLVGNEPRIPVQNGYYSYGRVIKIQHKGVSGIFTYAHLSERKVQKGDKVVAGQIIGLSGNTGHSFGPHLHIDIDGVNGSAVPWLESHGAVNAPAEGVSGTGGSGGGTSADCSPGSSGRGQTEVPPKDCPRTAPIGTIQVDGDVRKLCEDAVKQATSPEAARAILFAFANLGAPYSQPNRMGSNPNVFDCSSMVGRAFTAGGAKIKTASGQADWLSLFGYTGAYMPSAYEGTNLHRIANRAELKSGDVIIQFNGSDPGNSSGNAGHAQIYIGNNNIIQSSGPLNVAPAGNGWFSNEWYFRYTP